MSSSKNNNFLLLLYHPYQVRNNGQNCHCSSCFDNDMYCSSLMTTGRMDVLMLDLNQVVCMDLMSSYILLNHICH